MNKESMYKIGEFSNMTNVSIRTLQRWDNIGLLEAKKSPKGDRYYSYSQYEDIINKNIEAKESLQTYKPKEFAQLLNISVKTLQSWDKTGKLKAYKTMSNRRFYTKEQMFLYRDESEKYIDKKDNKLYKLCDFSNIIKVSTAALNTWSKKGILVPFNSSTNGKYYTNEHLMKYYCLDKYEDLNLVEKTYSVSEFSEMIGITKRNLQYWDNIGKMQVNRTITGTKYYTHEQFKDYQNSKIDMYRPRDLAKILNVPVKTIDNWDKVGFIKSNKTISGRKYYTYTAVQEIKSKIENKKNRDIK